MATIQPHLKVGESSYNRVYEKVYEILRTIHCTRCSAGTFETREPSKCTLCGGSGRIHSHNDICQECDGKGLVR